MTRLVGVAALGALVACTGGDAGPALPNVSSAGDGGSETETGPRTGGEGGGDATNPDGGTGGMPGAGGAEAGAPAMGGMGPAGAPGSAGASGAAGEPGSAGAAGAPSGVVGELGSECAPPGSLACAGNYQKLTLVCSADGEWAVNQTCGAGAFCDATPGPDQGICKAVPAACTNLEPGEEYCEGTAAVMRCGPDLVTTELVENCTIDCREAMCDPDGVAPFCEPEAPAPEDCNGTNEVGWGGRCYWFAFGDDDIAASWHDAEQRCVDWGGHLLTLTCRPEDEILHELASQVADPPPSFFVGANDLETEGQWRWTSGEIWSGYVPTARMNRRNPETIDCGYAFWGSQRPVVDGVECDVGGIGFVCER